MEVWSDEEDVEHPWVLLFFLWRFDNMASCLQAVVVVSSFPVFAVLEALKINGFACNFAPEVTKKAGGGAIVVLL